ncbi:MAG TPA: M4 family metallopeptidase [Thermoanaerobaculia bacterium]|nr:M4 family metallopeptidase [Thermoanaerobaculia bacterium]
MHFRTRGPILGGIPHCSILPAYLLRAIAANGDDEDRARALAALAQSRTPRRERQEVTRVAGALFLPRRVKQRTIFDANHERDLPGRIARVEGGARVRDTSVNEAYENAGLTYDYFRKVHGRRSLDDRGMRLEATVHFGDRFSNAHWNGRQMIYGDGDGKYFQRFTASLECVAHELTHGVTQYAAGLGASGQCGALAEHIADVFGILVKQHARKENASRADWLIGADLLTSRVNGEAIRSMKAPGTAYDDKILGRDPQPAHLRDYVKTHADDRGVHINSGIPNHAFYRVAIALGGNAWETAGKIWYRALTTELGPRSRFQHCADATWRAAGALFGRGSEPQQAVRAGWKDVGIEIAAAREAYVLPAAGAELPLVVGFVVV